MRVQAIALNTFREAIRNQIIYTVLLFAIFVVGVSSLFGAITIGSQVNVIKDFGLFSLSFAGAVITIICGVSLLNKELKHKTVYNILSKPVARWQFIVGKHLGLTMTVSMLVALMGVCLMLFAAVFEGKIDWLLLQGIFFAILEMIVVASIALFFSSLVVTTSLTGIFTLATYVAGRSIAYFQFFLKKDSDFSSPALRATVKVFDWILPDLSVFSINDTIVYGQSVSSAHALYAVAYCLAYSTFALAFAALIFDKRELN